MKKLVLLLVLSITFFSAKSQNWSPIPSGDPNFIVDSQLQRLVCIPIDSVVEAGTVKTFHIKRDFTVNFDTLTFDKSYFLGYSVSFDTVTGVVEAAADWPYRLEVFAPVDSSWSFNSTLTARVDSIVASETFGRDDSLKYISLDTALSPIVLSKEFGILQFPQLDTVGEAYTLQGVQNQAGDYQPGFDYFYDFDVNDSIQFKVLYKSNYQQDYDDHRFLELRRLKIKVIDKIETIDSTIYVFNGLSIKSNAVLKQGEREYTITYPKIDSLRLAVAKNGWFTANHGVFQQFQNEPLLKALGVEDQAMFGGMYTRFFYDYFDSNGSTPYLSTYDLSLYRYYDGNEVCGDCIFKKVNDTLFVEEDPIYFNDYWHYNVGELYYKSLNHPRGWLSNFFNRNGDEFSLEYQAGDVKGNKWGKFSPNSEFRPTSVAPENDAVYFSVFREGEALTVSSEFRMKAISLFNIQGSKLAQRNIQSPHQSSLLIHQLPSGIYLVEIQFENGSKGVRKVSF